MILERPLEEMLGILADESDTSVAYSREARSWCDWS